MTETSNTKIWTILEILKWTTDYFQSKILESPRLKAELLLCHLLNLKRIELYSNYDKPLSASELVKFKEWVVKASKHEPIQMIIGEVSFCGLKIFVDNSTIVPRPETELLTENIKLLNKNLSKLKILDIGSGSGCISLGLASAFPDSEVIGIDNSQSSVHLAQKNAEENNIKNVTFLCSDVSQYRFSEQFDLIVSNPPYIDLKEYGELEPEVKDWEPRSALTDEGDGLKYYRIFADIFRKILKSTGSFYLETGWNQNRIVRDIFEDKGFETESMRDFSGIDRFVLGKGLK